MLSSGRRHLALFLMVVLASTLASAPRLNADQAGLLASGRGPLRAESALATERGGVHLLSSTSAGVTFELDVPWERLRLEPVTVDGKAYVRVSLPGWQAMAQAGAPALPFLVQAIGAPVGVEVDVCVVPGRAHVLPLTAPALPTASQEVARPAPSRPGDGSALPTPTLVVEKEPAIYSSSAAYPGELAEVTGDGLVRQQHVIGVAVYPLQYEPESNELTVYESLRVEVVFEGSSAALSKASSRSVSADSPAYESLFEGELLNYETARAWRQPATFPSSILGRGGAGKGPEAAECEAVEGGEDAPSPRESGGIEGGILPWAPPVPGWRVKVQHEGFYRLTFLELDGAGLPVDSLDPRTFQLYNLGSEVAITVEGEEDGSFDSGDAVLFYGQVVDSKYTADNVYWLTYDPSGTTSGLRMASRDGSLGDAPTPAYYAALRQMEVNAYYRQATPGDDALERWLWDYVYPPSRPSWTHTFSLTAPYEGDYAGTLTVVMLGSLAYDVNPDHHVTISLNGTPVADETWDGITWKTVQVEVAQGLLEAGENTLSVVCPNDTGAGLDLVFVDRVALEFADTFVAEGNVLPFGYGTTGTWKFRVDGFTTDQLAVYDVTNPAAVVRIEGLSVSGSDPYSTQFEDTLTAPTEYWAMAEPAYQMVQAIEADTPSDLGSTRNGADHIVVTHEGFLAAAQALRNHRASQGLRAMVVELQDVYDEFGYGLVGAAAIRDFLAYAYGHWQAPAPSFAVLVGDGHYDPKNYSGFGRESFFPPYLALVDPWAGETAADNRYVTLVGDDTLPDMMLGRLAVNSSAEASAFVDKIIGYEQAPPGDWQQHVLAVADNADAGGDFAALSDGLLSCCLPEPYQAQKVYYGVTHTTVSGARAAILGGINAGKLIVNYLGHGATNVWASEGLFRNTDVSGLTNGGKLPVMLPMTCGEGYYLYPHTSSTYDAVAEVMTRADGKGAVASWSPTGKGMSTGHSYLDQGFFRAVFQDGLRSLGQATAAGKLNLWASGSNLDLLDTYLLFGDPALHIQALDADLQLEKAVEPSGAVLPDAVLTYTLTFTNAGPATAHEVVLIDILPSQLVDVEIVYESEEVVGRSGSEIYTWEIADLAPGASGEIRLRATVDPLAGAGTVLNEATITANEPEIDGSDNWAYAFNQIVVPDLWVDKSVSPSDNVAPGTLLTYTLAFGNAGSGIATGVTLTDTLPAQLVDVEILYESAEVAGLQPRAGYAWEIEDLAPDHEGQIRLRGKVDPQAAAGTLENKAQISGAESEADLTNNAASASNAIVIPELADLIVKKSGPAGATFGEAITYTIAWENAGAVAVPSVQLTDTLPAGVTYVADDSGWAHGQPESGVIVWDVTPDPLPAGAAGTFVLTATVGVQAQGPFVNSVRIAATAAEGDPADNEDEWTTELLVPDLWVDKSVSPSGKIAPGAILTYTLTFGNAGAGIAPGVVLTDTLPAQLVELEILYESPEVGSLQPGAVYAWEIEDLTPGDAGEIRVRARVASNAAGDSFVNDVQIGSLVAELDASDNHASVATEVSMWWISLPIVLRSH